MNPQELYRLEYRHNKELVYKYIKTLDEANEIGQRLLDEKKARRVKIYIIPVNGGQVDD